MVYRKKKHEGLVLFMTVLGSLFAVAAIAIFEAFVGPTDLVLTQGEFEILAALFYVVALIVYLFGGDESRGG
jgi:hypothetical protein